MGLDPRLIETVYANIPDWKRQQKMMTIVDLFRDKTLGIKFSTVQQT